MKKLMILISALLGTCVIMFPSQSFTANDPNVVSSVANPGTDTVGGSRVSMAFENRRVAASTATTAVEFYHAGKNHYFNTADMAEVAYLDAHSESGWYKTGYIFKVYPLDSAPSGTVAVARYYGAQQPSGIYKPDSHFYTGSAGERQMLDDGYRRVCPQGQRSCTGEAWFYEKDAYRVYLPNNGSSCLNGSRPVYRFYNNGFPTKDGNHRYTTDTGIAADMRAKGWIDEGVKMCVPSGENNTVNLTVNTAGNGSGSVTGGGSYSAGDPVSLGASPNAGSTFSGWSPPPCASSFFMPAYNLTCTATFTTGGSAPSPRFPQFVSPSNATAGSQINISLTAQNQSSQSLAFTAGIFLSKSSSQVSSSGRLSTCNFSLAPGGSDTCSGSITIPSATTPGNYYLIAYARDDWDAAVNPITITSTCTECRQ